MTHADATPPMDFISVLTYFQTCRQVLRPDFVKCWHILSYYDLFIAKIPGGQLLTKSKHHDQVES